jgi:hypothetical protein
LFYFCVAAASAGVIWLIYANRHVFQRGTSSAAAKPAAPRTVMGMDVTPDSLPADILAAARAKWSAGDARAALSLLYRGALVWLVHVARLRIQESDTEGDCLRHSNQLPEEQKREYFSNLTGQWMGAAYAERSPQAKEMENLLGNWPFQ